MRHTHQKPIQLCLRNSTSQRTNNNIKTMKRQAYHFRNQDFLKLTIFAIHEAKSAFVG